MAAEAGGQPRLMSSAAPAAHAAPVPEQGLDRELMLVAWVVVLGAIMSNAAAGSRPVFGSGCVVPVPMRPRNVPERRSVASRARSHDVRRVAP